MSPGPPTAALHEGPVAAHPSPRAYAAVFFALLLLTATTVGAAFVDLGPFNLPAALLIAALKATLVVLYFMHVRFSARIIWIVAGAGFLWLAHLIGGVLADYFTRPWPTSAG